MPDAGSPTLVGGCESNFMGGEASPLEYENPVLKRTDELVVEGVTCCLSTYLPSALLPPPTPYAWPRAPGHRRCAGLDA